MCQLAEAEGGKPALKPLRPGLTATHRVALAPRNFPLQSWFALLCLAASPLGCSGDNLTLPDEGTPVSITILSGDGQTDTVGHSLSDPLAVRVTDSKNRPVEGQAVSFTPLLNGTGAALIPDTAVTDADGRAESRWVLGTTRGQQMVRARVQGAPPHPLFADFTAVAAPGTTAAPAAVRITVQPSAAVPNTVPFPVQPQVQVQGAGGIPLDGVPVLVTVASGGGAVSGATVLLTDAAGVAAFSDLALTGQVGTHTLRFTAGAASATSAAITVTPGPASPEHSTATVPDGAAGKPTAITIQVRDVSNNLTAGGSAVVVNVSGTNSATPAVTDRRDGTYTASYTPTNVGMDVVAITVDGSAIAGSPATSTVRSGGVSASVSTLTASNPSVTASTGSSPATITVTALDGLGNPVVGVSVVFAATGSSNTFTPATATTDASGHASSAYSSTLSGSRTISATADGVTLLQTGAVTVNPDVADPGQTTARVPAGREDHPTVIMVQAKDRFGNKLTSGGSAVVVTVTGANNAGPFAATDNGDGTYSASYTPPNKGTDHVAITLDGVAIGASPYQSKVG